MKEGRNKKAIGAIISTVLILLITIPTIVILWTTVIPFINNHLLVDMSAVQLDIDSSQGYTVWDGEDSLLSVQIKRGDDDVKLDYIYFVITTEGNSKSYFVNALEKNQKKVYYFGEIIKKPEEIKVFASIPIEKGGKITLSNAIIRDIPEGNLNENEIINSGNWIYLPDGRVKTYDCKKLVKGVYFNADEGSYCILSQSNIGFCNDAGNCMDWGCAIDSNCYRGNPCEEYFCDSPHECGYTIIPGCGPEEGECGDGVINTGEVCDPLSSVFGGKTCQTEGYYSGGLKCSKDCQFITTLNCWDYVLEGSGDTNPWGGKGGWEECDTLWQKMYDDQILKYEIEQKIGWDLSFYGERYSSFYIDSNGKININNPLYDSTGQENYASFDKDIIAPLWLDLADTDNSDKNPVYICEHGNFITIRWDTKEKGETQKEDFEIKIYENGELYFIYNTIGGPTSPHEVFYGIINFKSGTTYYKGDGVIPSESAYKLIFKNNIN